MGWELIRTGDSLGPHKRGWDRLNREVCGANPYYHSDFIEPLLKHFSGGSESLCVLRDGSATTGMLIVQKVDRTKWSSFLPAQAQVSPIMVHNASSLQGLVRVLSPACMALDCLAQDPLVSKITACKKKLNVVEKRHALTVSIKLDNSFEEYWNARPKKLRQNVDRRFRKAGENGCSIQLRRVEDPDEIKHAVRRYGELESRGWKGRNGTAVSSDNVQGHFYVDVMYRFAKRKMATAYELYFDDRLVASRLAVSSGEMLVMLKTTYDEAESSLSPGRLLLSLVVRNEFERRLNNRIEFYTNANSDLISWSTDQRWISHYILLRNRFVSSLYGLRERAKRGRLVHDVATK